MHIKRKFRCGMIDMCSVYKAVWWSLEHREACERAPVYNTIHITEFHFIYVNIVLRLKRGLFDNYMMASSHIISYMKYHFGAEGFNGSSEADARNI